MNLYNSHTWKKLRKQLLRDNPLCVRCKNIGVTKVANVIDHCIPARDYPDFYDTDNLFNVCTQCHSDITKEFDNRNMHKVFTENYHLIKYGNKEFRRAEDGFPLDAELDKLLISIERVGRGVEIPPTL